jgi:hypothetical protein
MFMSIACYALHIRHPRAHTLPSLTATCQLCTVSLKAVLSTYNGFTRRALDPPDGKTAQPDPDIVRVARQAPSATTGRLVRELKADGQDEGEHPFDKGFAITKQLNVGRFTLKIDRDGPICAGLAGCVSHGAPSRSDGRGS